MNKEQIKEDQNQREAEEKTREETGQMINPDEQERAAEINRASEELKGQRDLGSSQGQSYASGEADRNRGSSHTGATDKGGAMREGTQEEKVNKGG